MKLLNFIIVLNLIFTPIVYAQEHSTLLQRYMTHLETGESLSKEDKNLVRQGGFLDKNYNYIQNNFLKNKGYDYKNYDSFQETIVLDLVDKKNIKKINKYISRKKSSPKQTKNFKQFLKKNNLYNSQIIMDKLQDSIFKGENSAQIDDRVNQRMSDIAKVYISQEQEEKINKFIANDNKKPMIVQGNPALPDYFIQNLIAEKYKERYPKSSNSDLMKFMNNFVISSARAKELAIFSAKADNMSPRDLGSRYRKPRGKAEWDYVKGLLKNKPQTFERIRSASINACPFKPQKFQNQRLLDQINQLSLLPIAKDSQESLRCNKLQADFSNIGKRVQQIDDKLKGESANTQEQKVSLGAASMPMPQEGPVSTSQHVSSESSGAEMSSQGSMGVGASPNFNLGPMSGFPDAPSFGSELSNSDLNDFSKPIVTTGSSGMGEQQSGFQEQGSTFNTPAPQNSPFVNSPETMDEQIKLGQTIEQFMNLGCKLKGGNAPLLDLSTSFLETLGQSTTALSLGDNTQMIASSLGIITSLTSSIMNLFKGETLKERTQGRMQGLKSREGYLKNVCSFRNFMYNLDNALAKDTPAMRAVAKSFGKNNSKISGIQKEISCYKSLQKNQEYDNLLRSIADLRLESKKECRDFVGPFLKSKRNSRSSAVLHEEINKTCSQNSDQEVCELMSELRSEVSQETTALKICTRPDLFEMIQETFSNYKNQSLSLINGRKNIKYSDQIDQLESDLSRFKREQASFSSLLDRDKARRLTDDIKVHMENAGEILLSTEEGGLFNQYLSDLDKFIINKDKKIKKAIESLNNTRDNTEKCNNARVIKSELNSIYSQQTTITQICNSITPATQTPFNSGSLSYENAINTEDTRKKCDSYMEGTMSQRWAKNMQYQQEIRHTEKMCNTHRTN